MNTKILNIDELSINEEKIEEAAQFIKAGKLVAFPTETVYGLGAAADNEEAVKSIFKAKGRPADNPLIVHVSDISMCERYVRGIPEKAEVLMNHFWGGPLTIIMKKSEKACLSVSAGLDTVGIRLPSHPVAHALIKAASIGIAAPSANISGKPSPTIAAHVIDDFNGKIDCIISSGAAKYGVESTVIDMSEDVPKILRPGAVSLEMIRELLPDAEYGGGGRGVPKSPGMKYKHYAPEARVVVVRGQETDISEMLKRHEGPAAIIDYDERKCEAGLFLSAGKDDSDYAARLFYLLRLADSKGVKTVLARDPRGDSPLSDALKNRLYKAAGGVLI